ncbi:uncharacterized protein LOC108624455 [Ceratina calcarata]|uniref:E3 ubiquitin-protein ligase E3D n=1 Tax=Ceratina calcarata TaxID=156304 RepID=A0AAJ7IXY6_9HYME|nr:uncharacterized protein LOC108624455 [Ceratina calcarata]
MECITLELRPRLQICNGFIHLTRRVNAAKIKIKLLEESIEATVEDDKYIFLTEFVKLIPNSLSALTITNNWICFRAQTKPESVFGSINTQVITNLTFNTDSLKNSIKNIDLLNVDKCNVMCSCCKCILTKDMHVKRTLPIPDNNYDPNEWFCCKHNHNNFAHNLTPSESDIFYGSFFFIVHRNSFNENIKIDKDTVICKRCLQYLGKVHVDSSLQLWSCTLDFNLLNSSETKNATDPFNDFLMAISTSMTGLFGEEIVLQCFMGKETHSLVLKPMDWYLNLMIEPKVKDACNVVNLQKVSVIKVLYKYGTNESVSESVNKSYCEVAFLVIQAGLEHLLTSTKRFPPLHRIASDFYIGYIYLDNPDT